MYVVAIAWSPDCRFTVSGLTGGKGVMIHEVKSGGRALTLKGCGNFSPVAWSPDGRFIAGANGETLMVCEAASGEVVLKAVHDGDVAAIAWSRDGVRAPVPPALRPQQSW